MRVYLHIGTHKTGSTAVQYFLDANREALEGRGVLYPRSGRPQRKPISCGHHLLASELTRPAAARRRLVRTGAARTEWEALEAELRGAREDVAVISAEGFDRLATEHDFQALRSRLDGLDVNVIVYLRRQDEFLSSYYCQHVLYRGETRGFEEFRRALPTETDYERLLASWEGAFGRESLIVRTYERPALVNGDVVDDFCAQIGVDPGPDWVRPPRAVWADRSYPRNVINCIRVAREAGMNEDQLGDLMSLFQLVYRDRRSGSDFLSPAQRAELLREFDRSNRAVAERYLDRGGGVLFDTSDLLDSDGQAEWGRRYGGRFGDLAASMSDMREALSSSSRSTNA
jgi:hypothetical protein